MRSAVLNFLHSGYKFSENETHVKYKFIFVNNIASFTALIAFMMGIARFLQHNYLLGVIDHLFVLLAVLSIYQLRKNKNNIELIINILLVGAYLLFTSLFVLAVEQPTRVTPFFVFLAGAFFTKGKTIGFRWLLVVLFTIAFVQFSGLCETNYTNMDIISLFAYLIIFYFVLNLYENLKTAQTNDLIYLNENLENMVKMRTLDLVASNDELKTEKRLLEIASVTDPLTGLYNRLKIEEIFEYEKSISTKNNTFLSLILVDLDNFKQINDTYGHNAGDIFLKDIAKLLIYTSRKEDTVVRWGGDEFIILLPNADLQEAREVAERLRKAIVEKNFNSVGYQTASFGISVHIENESLNTLIHKADKVLLEAKKNGKDCIVSTVI